MVILSIIFSVLLPRPFQHFEFSNYSQFTIGRCNLALALILPLCGGIIDISVAAVMGFAVVMVAWLQVTRQCFAFGGHYLAIGAFIDL